MTQSGHELSPIRRILKSVNEMQERILLMSHRNATIHFHADDLDAAADWYSDVLASDPVRIHPDSVEFRLDDGVHGLEITRNAVPAGEITCWHVDDVDAAVERLIALGARERHPRTRTSDGEEYASIIDPFGNLLDVA